MFFGHVTWIFCVYCQTKWSCDYGALEMSLVDVEGGNKRRGGTTCWEEEGEWGLEWWIFRLCFYWFDTDLKHFWRHWSISITPLWVLIHVDYDVYTMGRRGPHMFRLTSIFLKRARKRSSTSTCTCTSSTWKKCLIEFRFDHVHSLSWWKLILVGTLLHLWRVFLKGKTKMKCEATSTLVIYYYCGQLRCKTMRLGAKREAAVSYVFRCKKEARRGAWTHSLEIAYK